ncbi:hypothetical protein Patl1_15965 [Pistacia atlantica]|uniref:Uncharacterized protein n=1 Tax=Pistacia atlantica TaxID=434234 RepID=A0ACC1B8L2_9ROSI|nr:hypothetical protein Patl1_15965 [Pistacia atlantica]
MGQTQPVGTGLWVRMSLIGKLIRVSHHLHRDGIFIFNLKVKGCHMVHMTIFGCVDHVHHQRVKKARTGLLSGLLQQYRKSALIIMKLQQGEIQFLGNVLLHPPLRECQRMQIAEAPHHLTQTVVSLSRKPSHVYPPIATFQVVFPLCPNLFTPCPFWPNLLLEKLLTLQLPCFLDYDASTPQREAPRWSSASSSTDFADISEPIESESYGRSHIPSDGFKCGLCERFLSQRSPWSSRRIVRSGDMPVVGVLSCRHVFHAECLEQATPKTHRGDPPCPLCVRLQEENSPDQQVFSRLKNGFSRPRPSFEDGQSRPWGCGQVGECVERALLVPPRNNTMLLLNRSHIKKNLSLKGNSIKEFPGKLRKTGSYSSQLFSGKSVDQGTVGCSKTTAGPSMKR